MRKRQFSSVVKWLLTVAAVLFAVAIPLNRLWGFTQRWSNGFTVILHGGRLWIRDDSNVHVALSETLGMTLGKQAVPTGFFAGRPDPVGRQLYWRFDCFYRRNPVIWSFIIPLWALSLSAAAPAVLLWRSSFRANRRARIGHCPACGYDRRGLPDDLACPECGAA